MWGARMRKEEKMVFGRRQFFRALGLGVAGVAAPFAVPEALADSETNEEKRKARYQANSAEVQTYYRVNRYPPKK